MNNGTGGSETIRGDRRDKEPRLGQCSPESGRDTSSLNPHLRPLRKDEQASRSEETTGSLDSGNPQIGSSLSTFQFLKFIVYLPFRFQKNRGFYHG